MNAIQQIYFALRQVLRERKYFWGFFIIAVVFFGLLIYIPLVTIPGNTLAFQLKIFTLKDYSLMIFLSLLVGLNLAMQIYAWRKQRKDMIQSALGGVAAGISGIFGAVVGTASCLSCLVFVLSLVGLGVGSALFVLQYQIYFLLGAIVLTFISIYFGARKVNKVCISC